MEDNLSDRDSPEVFSITELLDGQISKLSRSKPGLMKNASIDGIEENVEIQGKEVDWEEILKSFYELDISSPRLAQMYDIQEYDSGSVHILQYRRKPGEKSKIELLRIDEYINGSLKISANESSSNPIYHSRSITNIEFARDDDQGLLIQRFQLKGYQKIISRDTVHYSVVGTFRY